MRKLLLCTLTAMLMSFGCAKPSNQPPSPAPTVTIQSTARDTAVALSGLIKSGQAQFHDQCANVPTATAPAACNIINRAGAALNALITAEEAYCGWQAGNASDPNANLPCTPVSADATALTAAVSNAAQFINDLKGVLQ